MSKKDWKSWGTVMPLVCMFIFVGLFAAAGNCERQEYRYPMDDTIERAVNVDSTENKFLVMKSIGFGGAGAGGMGAPQVVASSREQFLKLMPEDEPVYSSLEYIVRGVKTSYMAFIENRAGILLWEKEYQAPSRCNFEYIHWADRELVFSADAECEEKIGLPYRHVGVWNAKDLCTDAGKARAKFVRCEAD